MLKNEALAWLKTLTSPALYIIVTAFILACVLIPQLPLHYALNIGVHEGYGGDLPLVSHINTAEYSEHGTYRWTQDGTTMTLPGIGTRPLLLELTFLPMSSNLANNAPQHIDVYVAATPIATLPLGPHQATHRLFIPAHLMPQGTLRVSLHSTTFTPPNDPRELGAPLATVRAIGLASPGFVPPDWHALITWTLALVLCWAAIQRATPETDTTARWITGSAATLVALAALLDPPRWAYGAQPALLTLLWCALLVMLLRAILPPLASQLAIPLDNRTLGILITIVIIAFGLRYGGRLYPQSMEGDINFHTHRFNTAIRHGNLYLLARNRGVDFPYPPAGYLTLAPLALIHPHPSDVLQIGAALAESLSTLLIYAIVATSLASPPNATHRPQRPPPAALLAAAIYVFTAAGFMTSWWSFDTHIYTQAAWAVLLTALILPRVPYALLILLTAGVYLGHFGFFINTMLLQTLLLIITWIVAWRGNVWARSVRVPVTIAFVGILGFVVVSFYSAYLPLFLSHARTTLDGGLTELAQRQPVTRAQLWHGVWHIGIIYHFGFFPLMLLPIGLWHLWQRTQCHPQPIKTRLLVLMAGSTSISAFFSMLPFITLSSQSTRWLMFSAWTVAIAAALAVHGIWQCGRAGRVVVAAMAAYVVWNTATFWLGPLAWRIRPPEPF